MSSDTFFCPYCGSECTDDDRKTLETLREKAGKIGYSVRCKVGRNGVYEIINDRDIIVGYFVNVRGSKLSWQI